MLVGMSEAYDEERTRPTYAAAFRCIGPECEDHCCRDWEIPLDRTTYEAYRQFPPEPLGRLVSKFVILNQPGSPPGMYARIDRRNSGLCSFLGEDRLCGIQKEYGGELLSATCSIYPRSLSRVEGVLEGTLSLSCPAAARQVLLDPGFRQVRGDLLAGEFRTDNFYLLEPPTSGGGYKPYRWFGEIRGLVLNLVQDRSRPAWQRLFLTGLLCFRLNEVTAANEEPAVPAILSEVRQVLESRGLVAELEKMVGQPALRLDVVAKLLADRLAEETSESRFVATERAFREGGGGGVERLIEAERLFYRPLIEQQPHLMENYLLNYMLQSLFPFGREGSAQSSPQSLAGEFLLLATQFACMEVLLMGVAGYYREAFAAEHVVAAVQSFTRAVEHYPLVRRAMVEYVAGRGLSGLEGVVVLLKN
jgi:lysine-N-methylase